MTKREMRFELAKVAISAGSSVETAERFYKWINDSSSETEYDDTPIEVLAKKTRISGTIIKRSKENDIYTIGDLIRCGANKYMGFHNVGRGTVNKIDNALEEHFNIKNWYLT